MIEIAQTILIIIATILIILGIGVIAETLDRNDLL